MIGLATGHERTRQGFLDRIVVLDDDPTGVQTLSGVRVLLGWEAPSIAAALAGRPSVHLITNSRALSPPAAEALVADAATVALRAAPDAHVVLRGDSTLRGHLHEEYDAVCGSVWAGAQPPLLLVPAFPSAGRVTRDGVQVMERGGERLPLDQTEYAHDGIFSYTSARLLEWAEQRSGGLFAPVDGRELGLETLRRDGPGLISALLEELAASRRAAVLAPDAETDEDLALIAEGYAMAVRGGTPAVVRCSPGFAGVLAGTTALGLIEPPSARDGGVLVVCGSHVPTTTRQLAALTAAWSGTLIELDARALCGADAAPEIARAVDIASALLGSEGLAIIATPRELSEGTNNLEAGTRIAAGLARVAGGIEPRPAVIVAKGGITSAVTLQEGFGVDVADVAGPILPGVALWRAEAGGRPLQYVVVPGNVGADDLLIRLVGQLMER